MLCVWTQAWERSKRMPTYGGEFLRVLPTLDRRLSGSSAWINDFSGEIENIETSWRE